MSLQKAGKGTYAGEGGGEAIQSTGKGVAILDRGVTHPFSQIR